MWWLFKRKPKPDPEAIVDERWECSFSLFQKNRFALEDTHAYASSIEEHALKLHIKRKNQFCWVQDTLYRYGDFALEGLFSFGRENGNSSLGFIFRAASEDSYYYLLVSNRGYFRFDVVFNGNPRPLIEWTQLPNQLDEEFVLRVIAHGSHFSFFIGADFLGEVEDDTIDAGSIAFAAQNYDEKEEADFFLKAVLLESRPLEVEAWYYRWNDYVTIEPSSRMTLAETFFSMGQFQAAIVQIKKTFRDRKPDAAGYFLLAECFINLKLYEESLASIEKVLSLDPSHEEALKEKANLLYLTNRLIEARAFIEDLFARGYESSVLYNLLGNTEYGLGNWERAAEAYRKALVLEPNMPIFAMNAGRAFEMAGMRTEAVASYIDAAKEFFRQEAYDDLTLACERVRALDSDNTDIRLIEGKMLFNEEKYEEAEKVLRSVYGTNDSSVPFLLGLLEAMAGRREAAIPLLTEAAEAEPDFPLYWFKLAENLFLAGKDAGKAIEKALALAPDDMWTLNLAGLYHYEQGDLATAFPLLKAAYEKDSEDPDIRVNYTSVLAGLSRFEEALSVLEGGEPDAKVANQKGNILSSLGRYEEALDAYQAALRLSPSDPVILENCASVALAAERVTVAEEMLVKLLDTAPSERAFRMMGDVALALGEYARAEASYREALKLVPDDQPTLISLSELCVRIGRYEEAERLARMVSAEEYASRVDRVVKQIRQATSTRYVCSSCGREWWVPKTIEPQGTVRLIGEPMDESPAGKCPSCGRVYCVSCVKEHVTDGHFSCPECGKNLKLQDDGLRYLAARYADKRNSAP